MDILNYRTFLFAKDMNAKISREVWNLLHEIFYNLEVRKYHNKQSYHFLSAGGPQDS
jgi:hypothetical protein